MYSSQKGRRKQSYLTSYIVHVAKVPKSLILAMHFSEKHTVVPDVTENGKMEVVLKSYKTVGEQDIFSFSGT